MLYQRPQFTEADTVDDLQECHDMYMVHVLNAVNITYALQYRPSCSAGYAYKFTVLLAITIFSVSLYLSFLYLYIYACDIVHVLCVSMETYFVQ